MVQPEDNGPHKRPKPDQLTLELGHDPSLVEADFIVSDGNRLAMNHICAFPDWPGPLTLLTGPAKAGKSHLGRIWMARANAKLVDVPHTGEFAGEGGQTPLLVEDVDRSSYDEQALFHLLNQSMRDRRPLLMTARRSISDWGYQTDDLLSRARLAALFTVAMPDDTQLSQMFAKLFADRQIDVDSRVVSYLLPRMERSAEEVNILVGLMDDLALARRSPITRAIAADALSARLQMSQASDGD